MSLHSVSHPTTRGLNWVWDTNLLDWVPMLQPSGGSGGTITNDGTFAKESGGNLATLAAKDFATSAKQDTGNTSLASIDAKLASVSVTGPLTNTQLRASSVPVDPSGVTSPVSLVTVPNPSNLDVALSTRLKPADTLTKVATVDTITNPVAVIGPLTDTALRASAVPVSLATAPSTPVTNANLDSPLSGLKADLDKIPSLGQAVAAASTPVVLASDQSAIPITGSISASTSADVDDVDGDAGYSSGQVGKNLTQTPDGRLRVAAAGKVSDSRESYQDAEIRSLSLTTDGRLRVAASAPGIPAMEDLSPLFASADLNNHPWGSCTSVYPF